MRHQKQHRHSSGRRIGIVLRLADDTALLAIVVKPRNLEKMTYWFQKYYLTINWNETKTMMYQKIDKNNK